MRRPIKLNPPDLGFLLLNVEAATACINKISGILYLKAEIMKSFLKHLWNDDGGQDLIEYALLVGLVATGSAILLPGTINPALSGIYSRVTSLLDRFGSGGG